MHAYMHGYVIGIDGGGTKTEGVLTDPAGRVLAHGFGGASNPNDGGVEASVAVIASLARELIRQAGVLPTDCCLFGGIAGALSHKEELTAGLRASLSGVTVSVDSDMINLLSAELCDRDGACVICGTGSACFLRRGQDVTRIGGWGYLLDSAGSGYDIGRQALEAALRAHDGRGTATLLTDCLSARLGMSVPSALNRLYAEGKTLIASLAPAVFEAADRGDATATAILERNAAALGEMIVTAWRLYRAGEPASEPPQSFPVALDGGICRRTHPRWRDAIAWHIPPSVPAELFLASRPVLWGAVAEGMRRDGRPSSEIAAAEIAFLQEIHSTN